MVRRFLKVTVLVLAPLALFSPLSADAQEWETVDQWKGTGQMETQTFSIDASEWRVRWVTEPTSDYGGYLSVMVYTEGGNLVSTAANTTQGGSQDSYVHHGPGNYYLTVNGANMNWTVTVQQPTETTTDASRWGATFFSVATDLGVSPETIQSFDANSLSISSVDSTAMRMDASYPASSSEECRTAAAAWVTIVEMQSARQGIPAGDWRGLLDCGSGIAAVRAQTTGDSTRWTVHQKSETGEISFQRSGAFRSP